MFIAVLRRKSLPLHFLLVVFMAFAPCRTYTIEFLLAPNFCIEYNGKTITAHLGFR